MELREKLLSKIRILNETVWKQKGDYKYIDKWLKNFEDDDINNIMNEKINALYLLSKFMFFGQDELRELLLALFRDLIKYPIIAEIRQGLNDLSDIEKLNILFQEELVRTKFVSVGNSSESSSHILYYFRQVNSLSKNMFIDANEILKEVNSIQHLKERDIKRYIFIDDFCGTGSQASGYALELLEKIKKIDKSIEVHFLLLFSTSEGLGVMRKVPFDVVDAVCIFDDSFKCFEDQSRYYKENYVEVDRSFAKNMCKKYENLLQPSNSSLFYDAWGFGHCQLLIGLYHNTPDNTLPIFWFDDINVNWSPIFKRYPKIYE